MNLIPVKSSGRFLAKQFGYLLVAVADMVQILGKHVKQVLVGTLRSIV